MYSDEQLKKSPVLFTQLARTPGRLPSSSCHSSQMLPSLLIVFSIISGARTLNCHVCTGAEYISDPALAVLSEANITTSTAKSGNCNATSGSDACTDGSFCYKNAIVYKFSLLGMGVSWTSFKKGCTNTRLDNGAAPLTMCYDVNSTSYANGYTATVRQCYCKTDLCNFTPSISLTSSALILLSKFIFV